MICTSRVCRFCCLARCTSWCVAGASASILEVPAASSSRCRRRQLNDSARWSSHNAVGAANDGSFGCPRQPVDDDDIAGHEKIDVELVIVRQERLLKAIVRALDELQ